MEGSVVQCLSADTDGLLGDGLVGGGVVEDVLEEVESGQGLFLVVLQEQQDVLGALRTHTVSSHQLLQPRQHPTFQEESHQRLPLDRQVEESQQNIPGDLVVVSVQRVDEVGEEVASREILGEEGSIGIADIDEAVGEGQPEGPVLSQGGLSQEAQDAVVVPPGEGVAQNHTAHSVEFILQRQTLSIDLFQFGLGREVLGQDV